MKRSSGLGRYLRKSSCPRICQGPSSTKTRFGKVRETSVGGKRTDLESKSIRKVAAERKKEARKTPVSYRGTDHPTRDIPAEQGIPTKKETQMKKNTNRAGTDLRKVCKNPGQRGTANPSEKKAINPSGSEKDLPKEGKIRSVEASSVPESGPSKKLTRNLSPPRIPIRNLVRRVLGRGHCRKVVD